MVHWRLGCLPCHPARLAQGVSWSLSPKRLTLRCSRPATAGFASLRRRLGSNVRPRERRQCDPASPVEPPLPQHRRAPLTYSFRPVLTFTWTTLLAS
jgi:hypothetical protein